MVRWLIEEECLLPKRKITLEFRGLNPFRVYYATKEVALRIFEIKVEWLWERDFRWDNSADPNTFFVRFVVKREMDAKTYLFSEITLQGAQPVNVTKPGWVVITITGRLITEYKLDKFWKRIPLYKMLVSLYHRFIYDDVRKEYMRECNEILWAMWREYRSILGLPPYPSPR